MIQRPGEFIVPPAERADVPGLRLDYWPKRGSWLTRDKQGRGRGNWRKGRKFGVASLSLICIAAAMFAACVFSTLLFVNGPSAVPAVMMFAVDAALLAGLVAGVIGLDGDARGRKQLAFAGLCASALLLFPATLLTCMAIMMGR